MCLPTSLLRPERFRISSSARSRSCFAPSSATSLLFRARPLGSASLRRVVTSSSMEPRRSSSHRSCWATTCSTREPGSARLPRELSRHSWRRRSRSPLPTLRRWVTIPTFPTRRSRRPTPASALCRRMVLGVRIPTSWCFRHRPPAQVLPTEISGATTVLRSSPFRGSVSLFL